MIDTTHSTITDHSLDQLLSATPRPEVVTLHYVCKTNLTLPALCGEEAPKGGWDMDRAKDESGGNTRLELCPACQVRYSYMGG